MRLKLFSPDPTIGRELFNPFLDHIITLLPSTNTFSHTKLLRKDFMTRLRSYKKYNKKEFTYFSAIEIGKNNHLPNKQTQRRLVAKLEKRSKKFDLIYLKRYGIMNEPAIGVAGYDLAGH